MQQVEACPPSHCVTFKMLKDAIPEHCYERSYWRSFTYLGVNLAAIALVFATAGWLGDWWFYWVGYAVVQGCLFTGIWVLAHECGHRAFCPSDRVSDLVGWVLHSVLLVPYHAWRISHGKHHRFTNHLQLDEVFVPNQYEAPKTRWERLMTGTVVGRLILLGAMLLVGWPLYLLINASGRPYPKWANHWLPSSPVFHSRERNLILLSDLGIAMTVAGLAFWAYQTSITNVLLLYGLPYLVTNAWLVLITYLQHTDVDVPHYDHEDWTWLKGALCTVDRDFGVLNHVFHRITDTHVCHHLFPRIPHYHAAEATVHLRRVLGDLYRYDPTPFPVAMWRSVRECVFVTKHPSGEYHWERTVRTETAQEVGEAPEQPSAPTPRRVSAAAATAVEGAGG